MLVLISMKQKRKQQQAGPFVYPGPFPIERASDLQSRRSVSSPGSSKSREWITPLTYSVPGNHLVSMFAHDWSCFEPESRAANHTLVCHTRTRTTGGANNDESAIPPEIGSRLPKLTDLILVGVSIAYDRVSLMYRIPQPHRSKAGITMPT